MWSGIYSQALGRYNKLYPFQPANQSAAQCSMLVSSSTCYYYVQHCIHWQVFSHFTQWAHSHLDNLAILHWLFWRTFHSFYLSMSDNALNTASKWVVSTILSHVLFTLDVIEFVCLTNYKAWLGSPQSVLFVSCVWCCDHRVCVCVRYKGVSLVSFFRMLQWWRSVGCD